MDNVKYSKVVPREIFKGIFISTGIGYEKDNLGKSKFKDFNSGREELKKRIFDTYKDNKESDIKNLTYDNLVYTDELPSSIGAPFQYNVIVLPGGDSDKSAQRKDVKYTFLLHH
jgi:hypothetical protein